MYIFYHNDCLHRTGVHTICYKKYQRCVYFVFY